MRAMASRGYLCSIRMVRALYHHAPCISGCVCIAGFCFAVFLSNWAGSRIGAGGFRWNKHAVVFKMDECGCRYTIDSKPFEEYRNMKCASPPSIRSEMLICSVCYLADQA
jgi:hypothetical protein